MTTYTITSLQNPLVKQIRKLHRTKERHQQNLLLLEGTNLIEAACQINYPLVSVCCTPAWQKNHTQLWETIQQISQRIEIVTPEILQAIATTVNPDGVVASAPRNSNKNSIFTDIKLGLVIERLQDPGNLGTIIRTAVATNTDGLWLSKDSVDLDHPKVLRASAGEWFRLTMAVSDNLVEIVNNYRQQGVKIIATLPHANKTYWQLDLTMPSIFLLGNEGAGLSEELVSLADEIVTIPLSNGVESLNVAIASALLLYEAQRQKQLRQWA